MNDPKFNYRKAYEELETNFIDPDYIPLPLDDRAFEDDDLHGDTAPGDFEDWEAGGLSDQISE